jgi:two-component system CheB/CheR fusion protein
MKSGSSEQDGAPWHGADPAAQLRSAATALQAIAVIVVTDGGRITFWNAGAQRMFGYAAHEIIGRPLSTLLHTEAAGSGDATSIMGPGALSERWYRRRHGGLVLGTETAVSVAPPAGGGRVLYIRDITQSRMRRLATEQRLLEQEASVDTARRANAAKDRFLAVMSHELKQPLTELLLNTERLLGWASAEGDDRLQDVGRSMKAAIRRQVKVIDDLLELSRLRTGKLRLDLAPVNLVEVVRAACAAAAMMAPSMQINVDVPMQGDMSCMVDPVRLDQILSNLLGNAIKFSQSAGRIDVQLRVDRGHARISVVDNGCGIAAAFLPHVFSMFGQESRDGTTAGAGLGIGLALVHELVTAHGGEVEACSEGPGQGARFSLWLPLVATGSTDPVSAHQGVGVKAEAATRARALHHIGAIQATR